MDLVAAVDSFFGVDGGGSCLPGPYLPFGLARPGPDVLSPHPPNGYRTGAPITGFSQNHVSGTGGGGRYGNIRITPIVRNHLERYQGQSAGEERGGPGWYAVRLLPGGVDVEITCTHRCACYRFTFPQGERPRLCVDLGSAVDWGGMPGNDGGVSVGGWVEPSGDRALCGRADCQGGWGHDCPYSTFFYLQADAPMVGRRFCSPQMPAGTDRVLSGPNLTGWIEFPEDRSTIEIRVGISPASLARARHAVEVEAGGREFAGIRAEATRCWAGWLDRIRVDGGAEVDQRMLYSCLYRLLCMPSDLGVDADNPLWHSRKRAFTDIYCLWDSARNANSLFTLIAPEFAADLLNALMDIGDHVGWIPDAWIAGHSAWIQGGCSADVLFAEAAAKGLPGVDWREALRHVRKHHEEVSPDPNYYGRFLSEYRRNGWLTSGTNCSLSRNVEYSFQDWCLADLAGRLGDTDLAGRARASAGRIWDLWNDQERCFGPRKEDGSPIPPEGEWRDGRRLLWSRYCYEGMAHEWSLTIWHDMAGLVQAHGGPEGFVAHLDRFFDQLSIHWKEAFLHIPWLYHYAGRPDLSARRVQSILRQKYRLSRDGLPDNEDMGAQSAFVITALLGLNPVPGQAIYLIGVPAFKRSTLRVGPDGGEFTILATGAGVDGRVIVGARLDGRSWPRAWLTHAELLGARQLELDLAECPGDWGREIPPSPMCRGVPTVNTF